MRKILVLFSVGVLMLAACGDDESTANSSSGSGSGVEAGDAPVTLEGTTNNKGTAEASGDSLEVEMDDFYFNPTFIKGTPGQTITIELHNEGTATHTFTIDALDVDEEVAAGETGEATVTLPDAGASLFYCRFHQSSGMQGAFFFNEGDTVNAAGAGSTDDSGTGGGIYSN